MKDHAQRVEYIRLRNETAKKEADTPTYAIKNWRGRNVLYPKIIQVDVDYLMYRIENSRTEIQQLAYLRSHSTLPKNLFSDPELNQAQDAQEIILNQINKSAGKDFFEDLKLRGQDEPAIITYDGYLINGNRRTAALKSIGERYINCVVLPEDTNPKDIYELEQELQLSQDFREPYHWINELRNIRKGMEDLRFRYSEGEMAKRLRIDVRELKAKIKMLDLIDSFLIWKNATGQYDYSKLEDTEQVFIELEKAVKKYKDEKKQSEFRNSVFTLIEEKPSKGRLYGYVKDLIKNFDQVYEKLSNSVSLDENSVAINLQENNDSDLLSEILNGEIDAKPNLFDKSENAPSIAVALVEKIADVKAENREKTDNESVYESISSSLRELQGLSIEYDTAKKNSIKSKLEQIINASQELLIQLQSFE